MLNDTPSTAFRIWRGECSITRLSHGRDTSKSRARSRTSRSGFAALPGFDCVSSMHGPRAPVLVRSGGSHLWGVQPARGARIAGGQQDRALDLAAVEEARGARVEGAAFGNG